MTTATLWDIKQAAKYLNASERTVWELKKFGKIKFVPVGVRLIRFDPEDLQEYVEENRTVNSIGDE
jgi:excisionase family DNA binding protein